MKDAFINRKYVIITLIVLASLSLLIRLFIIQVVKDSYRLSADNNVLRYVTQYPARGLIYDRKGKLIVYNQAAYDLMVVPAQTSKIDTGGFCNMLGISTGLFREKMSRGKLFETCTFSISETNFQ
jgi:penicillin-binding protein 2